MFHVRDVHVMVNQCHQLRESANLIESILDTYCKPSIINCHALFIIDRLRLMSLRTNCLKEVGISFTSKCALYP